MIKLLLNINSKFGIKFNLKKIKIKNSRTYSRTIAIQGHPEDIYATPLKKIISFKIKPIILKCMFNRNGKYSSNSLLFAFLYRDSFNH
jgi:hypothetical protein